MQDIYVSNMKKCKRCSNTTDKKNLVKVAKPYAAIKTSKIALNKTAKAPEDLVESKIADRSFRWKIEKALKMHKYLNTDK